LEEAIDRVMELAGVDKERTRVVEYRRQGQLLELFGGMAESRTPTAMLHEWLEQATPRAYFLPATVPPMLLP
jgi:hypothetical protein